MARLKSDDDTISEKLEKILEKYSKEFRKLAIKTEKKIVESLAESKDLDTSIALALKGFDYSNRKITIKNIIDLIIVFYFLFFLSAAISFFNSSSSTHLFPYLALHL